MKQSHLLRLIVAALSVSCTISYADTAPDPAKGEETEAGLQGRRASKATAATPQTTASQHLSHQRQIPR